MIEAVIFDMNGVIIDDEHIHELAFKEVLKQYKIDLNHGEYTRLFAGKTDRDGFEEMKKYSHVELDIEKCLHEKSERYLALFPQNKKSYPGVVELIQALSRKYILALTSSAIRKEVDLTIKVFGIEDRFRITISGDDVTNGKPDPEPYLKTAAKLNLDPAVCVVIEDSKSGVQSAKAAGMTCFGITTTHTANDLSDADEIFTSFDEIEVELL